MALLRKAEADVTVSDISHGGDILDALDGGIGINDLEESSEVNKMAERALLRLRQKLEGIEEGVHLSVSGQVSVKYACQYDEGSVDGKDNDNV